MLWASAQRTPFSSWTTRLPFRPLALSKFVTHTHTHTMFCSLFPPHTLLPPLGGHHPPVVSPTTNQKGSQHKECDKICKFKEKQ
ncbi:hypothetical protein TRSC58_07605 [Trypanosoma rangeli SC58]|uniref:Uncharacterized protein n=1 Tax=Trypanosoma rangeli SC58 TaxID=429131 RepID=A0A061IRJ5_TRYRA|nr:hypothetical protein TRSC58_07605 [Trypanosoma rangeli SC58]